MLSSSTDAELTHFDTMYDRENGHPSINLSTFSFSFIVQGNFENGEFTDKIDDTIHMIQKDIKRKANKGSISRGTYDISDFEKGLSKEYVAVDAVTCEIRDSCQPTIRGQNDCYIGDCTMDSLYDIATSEAEAEYKALRALYLFFTFGGYDQFEHSLFAGPFSFEATVDIELFGVPPFQMDQDATRVFESEVTEFFGGMPSDSWLQVRPVVLRSQSILDNIEIETSMAINRKRTATPTVLSGLKTVLSIYSLHGSLPSRKFNDEYFDYLNTNGDYLVKQLRDSGNDYFIHLEERDQDLIVNESNNVQITISEVNIPLVGIAGIFICIIVPTTLFILFKVIQKKISAKNTGKKLESHVGEGDFDSQSKATFETGKTDDSV